MTIPVPRGSRKPAALFCAAAALLASNAHALLEIDAMAPPPDTVDFREGTLKPSALQLAQVNALGATASWNRFGTVHSMMKQGGYLATGLSGTPAQAARSFVKANAALFKLSPASVDALEVVNEGITPNNAARAVLFRQKFGDLSPSQDGLITVGMVEGKVYYVSSSSAGDQPPASAASLSPLQAWMIAAADVKRAVSLDKVVRTLDMTQKLGWHTMEVKGFNHPQRARLTAIPMPNGGVRQAWETIVLNANGGDVIAFVHFIDAQTGKVLRRENRVNWQSQPTVEVFQGAFATTATCGPRHDVEVPAGQAQIAIVAASAQPANDIIIKLYYLGVQVVSADTGTSPDALTYAPAGGVPPGLYSAEVCPFDGTSLPPSDYAGTFTYTDVAGGAVAFTLPSWKSFQAYPLPDYSTADNRDLLCWAAGTGCVDVVGGLASRAPWDVNINTGQSTMTTIGNNAVTAESWGSPLTPSSNYRPVSPTRSYSFAYENTWASSKCDPTVFVPQGNDIDATVTDLFVKHNRMHDWSYHLGFTELNYNLQMSNFGNTGTTVENDPEIGNVQAGAVSGGPSSPTFYNAPGRDNANQITLQDGVPGITNQYLFQSLGGAIYAPCADGDYDMGIVGHEYGHAITNRMIGGPDSNIGGAQGGAMGEAWGDLLAGEFLASYDLGPLQDEKPTAIGLYATGNKNSAIRNYSLDLNPLNYSNLGYDTPGPQVHADSEIWSGTNWEIRKTLAEKYNSQFPANDQQRIKDCANGLYAADACPGSRRWAQLMFDSYLLMPASLSMLDARDAMLAADLARFGGANQTELWRIFAKRGMGKNAYSSGPDDGAPIGNFESPLEAPAVVTFKVLGGDEANAAIVAAIRVGQFQGRTRPIADTDPATVIDTTDAITTMATGNLSDTARMVPGTYDFMVGGPGYGHHRFTATVAAGASTLTFTIPTNLASVSKGATVVTSATAAESITPEAMNTLIDDDEGTGVRIGDEGLVEGAYAIVQLAGGAKSVSRIHLSTSAGPANPGRFTGIRQFEVRTCSGTCANPATDFSNIAFTSAEDAFPSVLIRPTQPTLNQREFDFPAVTASHVMVRVIDSQCTGNALYLGDNDNDPLVNADCATFVPPLASGVNVLGMTVNLTLTPPGSVVRASDIQLFGSKAEPVAGGSTPVTTPPPSGSAPVIGGADGLTGSGATGGRFGGGALSLGLLLPLLLTLGRRRRMA
ncbi:MAG: M36 family metallopeptidase [Pseudomonadota bacterium]